MEDTVKFNVGYLTKKNELSKIQEVILSNDNSGFIQLKSKVAETFAIPPDSFDIFFGTKRLECLPDSNVKDVGLASGMKLYAIEKLKVTPAEEPSPPDYEVVRNAMYGLSTMFSHSRQSRQRNKTAIIKFIEDKEAIDAIIKSVAGLESDRIALDIMKNAKLLEVMLDHKNTQKIIDNHPCLATAFVKMWNSLISTNKYSNFEPVASTSLASNSQELMEVDGAGSQPQTDAPSTLHNITSSQLAAALAQTFNTYDGNANVPATQTAVSTASTNGAASVTERRTTQNRLNQRNDRPIVTPEAMQQALMSTGFQQVSESVMSDGASGVGRSTVSEDTIKSGLEQLRAMGITDEAVCRQALIATQGNVEAAINIIFSGS